MNLYQPVLPMAYALGPPDTRVTASSWLEAPTRHWIRWRDQKPEEHDDRHGPERGTQPAMKPGQVGSASVSFVAVNVEQADALNGASGRHFIEQRERHERMRDRLTARLLAGAHHFPALDHRFEVIRRIGEHADPIEWIAIQKDQVGGPASLDDSKIGPPDEFSAHESG